jgi:hypothetical protein
VVCGLFECGWGGGGIFLLRYLGCGNGAVNGRFLMLVWGLLMTTQSFLCARGEEGWC